MTPVMANLMNVPTLLLVLGVVMLLFGSSKIPSLMRSLGSGMNEFKKGLAEGEKAAAEEAKAAEKPAEKPAEKAPETTPKA